ncbi:MAG: T9SS type A sorting domain-containing protein, partial [bacterium]
SDQIVSLKVFDTMGREVATLVNERHAPGTYRVTFDADGLPSGIYFARMVIGGRQATSRKMLLVE